MPAKVGKRKLSPERQKIFDALASEIPIADLCKVVGLSREHLDRMTNKNIIELQPSGQYHFGKTMRALLDHYRETSNRRKIRHEASADERNRLTAAKADMAEMDRGVMLGELLPSGWVSEQYVKLASLFRTRMMALPDLIAPRLVKYMKEAKRFEEVRTEIRDAVYEAAEEISALEINYDTRPLKFRPSGRAESTDGDAEGDETPAEFDA